MKTSCESNVRFNRLKSSHYKYAQRMKGNCKVKKKKACMMIKVYQIVIIKKKKL